MAFAEGENLVGRFEDMKQGQTPRAEIVQRPGVFLASGFPGLRCSQGRARRAELDSYLLRIADRDFEEQGRPVCNPVALRRWIRAYAAAVSTTATFETIRDAATNGQREKPVKSTTTAYRDILERLWIIEPVPAWLPTRNHLAALAVAPKHQLADPALAARLLGVDEGALLQGKSAMIKDRVSATAERRHALRDASLSGRLFESLVTLNMRVYAQSAEASVHHARTHEGRQEIDLMIVRGDQRVVAVEVKMGAVVTDDDERHLHWLRAQLGDAELPDAIVVTTGARAHRRSDGIGMIPAALFGPQVPRLRQRASAATRVRRPANIQCAFRCDVRAEAEE